MAKKWLIFSLTIIGVAFLFYGIYLRFFTPLMPECNAVIRVDYNDGENTLSKVLFISIVNINARESAFIINGTATYNNKRFTIARTATMTYTANEGSFLLRSAKVVPRANDDSSSKELNPLLSAFGKGDMLTVEKINDKQYIFTDNSSPNFICSKR